jgi:hypothetical protein
VSTARRCAATAASELPFVKRRTGRYTHKPVDGPASRIVGGANSIPEPVPSLPFEARIAAAAATQWDRL